MRVPGCRPYAEAVGVQGEKINRCAPGGEAVMLKIAALLNVDPQPVDGDAQEAEPARMLAVIDEPNCIGCTKCIGPVRWMPSLGRPAPCIP